MTDIEIAAVSQLLHKVESVTMRRPLNDHMLIDLQSGGHVGFVGLTVIQQDQTQPIAYCQVSQNNSSRAIELVIHPDHTEKTLELGRELITKAFEIIGAQGGGQITWWIFEPTSNHIDLTKHFGFNLERKILQMRVNLPLSDEIANKSIATTSFQTGIDDFAWLDVNNRAFQDHSEQGGWTAELFKSRQTQQWFDAKGLLMHHIDQQLVGFCWTKIDNATNPNIGEIYVVAVDPKYHNQGMGRSLTISGLNYLAKAGATTGLLYVDDDNFAAFSMYTKLGFQIHHLEQVLTAKIPPSR